MVILMESENKSSNVVLPTLIGIGIIALVIVFLAKYLVDQEERKAQEAYENNTSILNEHIKENEALLKKNASELEMINSFARVMSEYEKRGY